MYAQIALIKKLDTIDIGTPSWPLFQDVLGQSVRISDLQSASSQLFDPLRKEQYGLPNASGKEKRTHS